MKQSSSDHTHLSHVHKHSGGKNRVPVSDMKPALALQMEHDNLRNSKFKDGGLTWEDYKNMRFTQHVSPKSCIAVPSARESKDAPEITRDKPSHRLHFSIL